MGLGELFFLAVGLSMDAFAVSVCKGLATKTFSPKNRWICGFWFGGFQALMPVIGFFLGSLFQKAIAAFDHWVAFVLLGLIGVNMLREAFAEDDKESTGEDLSAGTMFVMAVATSIDALAVGISLALTGNVNIFLAGALIGTVTFLLCSIGFRMGSVFGCRFEQKAEVFGGVILILLAFRILLEHLEVMA